MEKFRHHHTIVICSRRVQVKNENQHRSWKVYGIDAAWATMPPAQEWIRSNLFTSPDVLARRFVIEHRTEYHEVGVEKQGRSFASPPARQYAPVESEVRKVY